MSWPVWGPKANRFLEVLVVATFVAMFAFRYLSALFPSLTRVPGMMLWLGICLILIWTMFHPSWRKVKQDD